MIDLRERIEKHKLWMNGETDGERLVLTDNDLSHCDLRGSDLRGSDLSHCDLRGSDLRGCDLRDCDLSGSDLSGSDLRGSDLRCSDLRGCHLRGCNFLGATIKFIRGNGREIKSGYIEPYEYAYTSDQLAIGCEQHSIEQWWIFSDDEICEMDGECAVEFWKENKNRIRQMIENDPAITVEVRND